MEQYIPKSIVLAEIDRILDNSEEVHNNQYILLCNHFKHFLDTLKVKEVDLNSEVENEIDEYWYDNDYGAIQQRGGTITMEVSDVKEIAKHFFELGLNAQYSSIGIPNIDDIFEENGIDPNSKDAKIFKECYYMELEKLKAQKVE